MIQIVGRVLAFWLLMIITWYDTPFIGGGGVGRMMVFQCGTWRVLVGLGIVIKCGTWRVLTMPTSLLSMQIRHLRWHYFEIYELIIVVGLVASFQRHQDHLIWISITQDMIRSLQPKNTSWHYNTARVLWIQSHFWLSKHLF